MLHDEETLNNAKIPTISELKDQIQNFLQTQALLSQTVKQQNNELKNQNNMINDLKNQVNTLNKKINFETSSFKQS